MYSHHAAEMAATPCAPLSQADEDGIIQHALRLLEKRVFQSGPLLDHLSARDFVRMQLAGEDREVFAVLFLNAANQVLAFEKLFFGTLDRTEVHPRVVVRRALQHNCASVMLAHNHPSGRTTPSIADVTLTEHLRQAFALFDIRVMDHFVIGEGEAYSFATAGLL